MRSSLPSCIQLHIKLNQWQIGTDVVGSGKRFDSSIEDAGSRMGGYAVVNARVSYQFNKLVAIEVNAQNLADRKYELARGYNPQNRSVFVNLKLVAL